MGNLFDVVGRGSENKLQVGEKILFQIFKKETIEFQTRHWRVLGMFSLISE